MKIQAIKTGVKGVFRFQGSSNIDIVDSNKRVIPPGSKVIVLDSNIPDHMVNTIVDNFYDVDFGWLETKYPKTNKYILNTYKV